MSEPPIASRLVKPAWSDFRQAWRGLVLVEVLFKLFEAWLLVPAIAWVLSFVLARTGQVAVSNRDVLGFLLSPWGLLYVAIVVIVAVALLLLEQAGLMAVVQASAEGPRTALWQLLAIAWTKMWRITQLGAAKALLLTATFVPFMLIALATYGVLLTRYDIYFYWKERPPIFWLAVTIGVVLLVAALAAAVWLYVRWAFALPILLFERQPASAALRLSHDRSRRFNPSKGRVTVSPSRHTPGIVIESAVVP